MKPRAAYPDISDIVARKAAGRRQLANLSFGEKLDLLDALRARVEPIRRSRRAANAGTVDRPRPKK
jgi:hypothetical protein